MRIYLLIAMICIIVTGAAMAGEAHSPASPNAPVAMDQNETADTASLQYRLVHAKGQHTCQSRDSIGHTCEVFTMRATDCKDAYATLKQQSCCSSTEYGGHSIQFKLLSCSSL